MEDKKKRTRPTVAQVKALEAEISELKERLRLSSNGESYASDDVAELRKVNNHLCDKVEVYKKTIDDLKVQLSDLRISLEKSNAGLEEARKAYEAIVAENERLMSRSLIQRILNR